MVEGLNMNKLISGSVIFKSTITFLLYSLSSSVWAVAASPGQLIYGPVATPVPTLSGPILIILALLLATIGYRILRQKNNHAGRMMTLSLIAIGALASGIGGVKLIDDAYASFIPETDLVEASGGVVDICSNCGTQGYRNVTNAVTKIKRIVKPEGSCEFVAPGPAPSCTEGLFLSAQAICYLNCSTILTLPE